MTLDRVEGQIVFYCDSCPEVLETETRDFDEARTIQHNARWKARRAGAGWEHSCPVCVEKEREKQ